MTVNTIITAFWETEFSRDSFDKLKQTINNNLQQKPANQQNKIILKPQKPQYPVSSSQPLV